MSYCRWSSVTEEYQSSDVYVYESRNGFEVHISGKQICNPVSDPHPVWDMEEGYEGYLKYQDAYSEWRERNKVNEVTDFEYSGQSFTFDSIRECIDFLKELKRKGVHVPQYAINDLIVESMEMKVIG